MKQETLTQIVKRARSRKNGIYTWRGVDYAVINSRPVFLIDYEGVWQLCHGFLCRLGEVGLTCERRKILKQLIKEKELVR